MNFVLAFLCFAVFAFILGWGVILLLSGLPWLLLAAMLVFVGAFVKFGCWSQ
jgi:hypothetical protein